MSKLAKRFKSQVNSEAQLRFGPERRNLRGQKREAKRTYRGDVRSAKVVARGQTQAARAADPVVREIFSTAGRTVDAGPSPEVATSSLGAAASRDAQGTHRRLAETMAMAQQELVSRQQDAQSGKALAIGAAQGRRDEAVGKANEGLRGLARDAGAFRQGRTGELVETARGRAVTRRGQDKTSENSKRSSRQSERNSVRAGGRDPDSGAIIPGGKLDPDANGKPGDQRKGKGKGKDGPGSAAPGRVESATSALALGRSQARKLKGSEKRSKDEALELLVTGRSKMTLKVDKDGKPLAQPVPIPGVSRVKESFARAAVELEYDGFVSAATRKRLRALGYSMAQLGLPKVGGPGGGGGHNSGPTRDGSSSRPT